MITFSDFKNKRAELKENRNQYKESIRSSINDFIGIYINSLALPAETFRTEDSGEHPYVYVLNENGGWSYSFTNLKVDKINGATFELFTVVDDEPPLPRPVGTRINVHYLDDQLVYVLVADRQDKNISVSIKTTQSLSDFSEIVKSSIISKIESEPFGKKSSDDGSVKLWE